MAQQPLHRRAVEQVRAVLHEPPCSRPPLLVQEQREVELGRARSTALAAIAGRAAPASAAARSGGRRGPGRAACGSGRAPAAAPPPASRTAGPGGRRPPARPRAPGAAASAKSGSPERSSRSTRVLTKKPISPSVSSRLRLAIGEPTTTSSWPAERGEQHLEARQEHHEQACAPSRRGERHAGRAERPAGSRTARSAGRDGSARRAAGGPRAGPAPGRAGQRAGASRRAALEHVAAQPVPLPERRSRRTGRAAPAGATAARHERLVERRQLAQEDADRPAVGGDVVEVEQQHVLLRAATPQQERAAAAAAGARSNGRAASSRPAAATRLPRGPPAAPDRSTTGSRHGLQGGTTWTGRPPTPRSRAQHLVAAHDLAEGAPRAPPSRASPSKPDARPGCCRAAARLEPIEEPEPLLGEGERQLARPSGTRRTAAPAAAARRCSIAGGQAGHGRAPRRSARSGSSTPKASRTRETSWVASSEWPPRSKKSSWTPTRSTSTPSTSARARPAAPRPGVRGAARSPRRAPAARRAGAGRARRSTLPLGGQRQPSSGTKADGTMYSGRRSARKARRSARRDRCAFLGHHEGHQAPSPGTGSRATTTASRTPGWASERRLDLPQLDPEAADLHLVVEAAEELQLAVRAPAAQVARPVQRAPGSSRKGSGRNRSAVSPAGPDSRARRPRRAMYSSPGTPDRHRLQVAVQHVDPGVRERPADRGSPRRGPARTSAQVVNVVSSDGP